MSMAHRIRVNDVRRTLVEFGRCFLSCSVVGGSLQATRSITAASKLSEEFDRYTQSNNDDKIVRSDCRKNLLLAGTSTEELIPSVGRLAVAVSNVTSRNESVLLKSLYRDITLVIKGCIQTCTNYYKLFYEYQNPEVRYYNDNH